MMAPSGHQARADSLLGMHVVPVSSTAWEPCVQPRSMCFFAPSNRMRASSMRRASGGNPSTLFVMASSRSRQGSRWPCRAAPVLVVVFASACRSMRREKFHQRPRWRVSKRRASLAKNLPEGDRGRTLLSRKRQEDTTYMQHPTWGSMNGRAGLQQRIPASNRVRRAPSPSSNLSMLGFVHVTPSALAISMALS